MEESDEETSLGGIDAEIKELLGLFDVPAFARRGQDLEYALARLRVHAGRRRDEMLDMVRLRLRQWSAAAHGPEADLAVFQGSIATLWGLAGAEPPKWGTRPASRRGLRTIARDLVASVERFNRRWADYLDRIDLGPINQQVDHYNRYYLLEKECSLGSARLAARHFVPKARVSLDELRAELPLLPVPALKT
ncbi:hypothetical protein P12x_000319 [Tundrisphaera lichenicola]|uniref:hypothetical protein n=1 Tax=Tundrisphaera lichenicola TaxID=2029860 RepID=UPI003EC0BF6A